jgi:hypothetical protein
VKLSELFLGEGYYEPQHQNEEYFGNDEYENILTAMRQRVKQMKSKLKPDNPQKQYNSIPLSARTSKSQLHKTNVMHISAINKEDGRSPH